nr:hypothetical protein [Burkholderia multivorans]
MLAERGHPAHAFVNLRARLRTVRRDERRAVAGGGRRRCGRTLRGARCAGGLGKRGTAPGLRVAARNGGERGGQRKRAPARATGARARRFSVGEASSMDRNVGSGAAGVYVSRMTVP